MIDIFSNCNLMRKAVDMSDRFFERADLHQDYVALTFFLG
jgi:hypothetical protein